MLHTLQDSGYYKPFTETVHNSDVFKAWLESKYGSDNLDVAVDDVMARYGNLLEADAKGDRFAAAEREVYAEFVGDKLFGGDFESTIKSLGRLADRSVIGTIRRFFHNLAVKFKGTAEEKALLKLEKEFDKLYEGRNLNDNNSYESIYFSFMNDKSLEDNIKEIAVMTDDDALARKQAGQYIKVLDYTPSVILNNVADAADLQMIIRFDAAYLETRHDGALDGNYHNFGEDFPNELLRVLNAPDAIVRMKNGRINMFGTIVSETGKTNIVSVELNTVKDINSQNKAYNLVVSAFTSKSGYIDNLIAKNGKKIEYKKEDLPQVNPQLHKSLSTINEKSSDFSISQGHTKGQEYYMRNDGNNESDYAFSLSPDEQAGLASASKRIDRATGKIYNEEADREQYRQYKEVLRELAPVSFDEFQYTKINDPDKWTELKDRYQVVDQYKIDSGSFSVKEILDYDDKIITEKRNNFISDYKRSGNIAGAYLDDDTQAVYYAHSMISNSTSGYKGGSNLVLLKDVRRFKYDDVLTEKGTVRSGTWHDTEAKLFEYFADLYETKPFKRITMLSERGMCDSCKSVMEQFKALYPDVTINVVLNKKVEGNVWKYRRRNK